MGLSFLPPEYIQRGLDWLNEMASSEEAKLFVLFYQRYWLNKWGADTFSVFRKRVRTNNDLEGEMNLLKVYNSTC